MGKDTQQKITAGLVSKKASREFSSGGVVYKGDKWLIRSTMPSKLYPKMYWMLPKGWIDNETESTPGPISSGKLKADEDSLQKTALREVREETGVEAKIIKKIGAEKHFFKDPVRGYIIKFVTFYLMEHVKDLPEGHDGETSEVVWLQFDEARKKLSFSGEKQILTKAKEILDK